MLNPASVETPAKFDKNRRIWRLMRRFFLGLAQDYWKDGRRPSRVKLKKTDTKPLSPAARAAEIKYSGNPREVRMTANGLWQAMPGEIEEKIWGSDYVLPDEAYLSDRLVRPLGLNPDMVLLDLSAGLGGRLRKLVREQHAYIEGVEADAAIAERGMALSIADGLNRRALISPYDPQAFAHDKSFDAVLAREAFYKVADKQKLARDVAACLKDKAQVSFTDYIVNAELLEKPAIAAWMRYEAGARPPGLVEMAEIWARADVDLRVHEDMTDHYRKTVLTGLAGFAQFMAGGIKPDPATRAGIDHTINLWACRMAAIEQGMQFYRFYGQK